MMKKENIVMWLYLVSMPQRVESTQKRMTNVVVGMELLYNRLLAL